MPYFTDQTGRTIELKTIPERIISLVPSQTEFLFDIGLDQQVVGVTKFCIRPIEAIQSKRIVGGTKNVNIEIIRQLSPQIIIANKEENTRDQIEELSAEYPVWISDICNLQDALEMMQTIGSFTDRKMEANRITQKIEEAFKTLSATRFDSLRVAYLIWKNPYMAAGGDTFIHEMLQTCGFLNVFGHLGRYPNLSLEELKAANCEVLLLSSEPYPFKQKHIDEIQQQLPNIKILLVDGEMFSWYGSRLQYSPTYFQQLRKSC